MRCLTLSVLSAKPYEGASESDGVEKGVAPLLTRGAVGAEILTGELGAVVIEYPDPAAARAALEEGRRSRTLADYVSPKQIQAYGRLLFIDYSREAHVRQVVQACGRNPDKPPPTPA